MSEAIFVEGLTKTYAGKTVVDHLDLSVKSGTVFGLLGANGAGKSTTISPCWSFPAQRFRSRSCQRRCKKSSAFSR